MFQTVKLAKLRLSPINVRTVSDDQLRIPEMAADIGARGVLQNLLVTPVTKPRGIVRGVRWRPPLARAVDARRARRHQPGRVRRPGPRA